MALKASTVRDDFLRGLDGGWVVGSGAPQAATSRVDLPAIVGSPAEIHWPALLDLTDSAVFVKVAAGLAANTNLRFALTADAANAVSIVVVGPNPTAIRFRCREDVVTTDASADFNPAAHAWWRIAERAGTLMWDTSPDGHAWANRRVHRHGMDLQAVRLSFGSGATTLVAGFGGSLFGIGPFGA